jgi:hypothetical protein
VGQVVDERVANGNNWAVGCLELVSRFASVAAIRASAMKNTVLLFVLVVAAAALDSESEEQTDAPNFTYAGQLPDQVQELPDSGEVPAANKAVRDVSLKLSKLILQNEIAGHNW